MRFQYHIKVIARNDLNVDLRNKVMPASCANGLRSDSFFSKLLLILGQCLLRTEKRDAAVIRPASVPTATPLMQVSTLQLIMQPVRIELDAGGRSLSNRIHDVLEPLRG